MIKISTFVSSAEDVKRCQAMKGVSEVLLEPHDFGYRGRLSRSETIELARLAKSSDLKPVLIWDNLLPQKELENSCKELTTWPLEEFHAIRVRDIGAAAWLTDNTSETKLQLIFEFGNHNLEALKGWCECFGERLDKITLSPQLTEEKLIEAMGLLAVDTELLAAGPILFFSTPRRLLSHLSAFESDDSDIEVIASSEESSSRDFPTLETKHGTFMYLDKDYFILDRLSDLEQAGLNYIRIDLVQHSTGEHSAEGLEKICALYHESSSGLKEAWPGEVSRPFFKSNNTTAQFRRLKSHLHALRDEKAVATVLAVEKGQTTLFTLRNFKFDESLSLALPNKTFIDCSSFQGWNINGEELNECRAEQVILTSKIKHATSGALIRRK